MTPKQPILSETKFENGVTMYWVSSSPKGRHNTASYPVLWGYVFNGVKYTSKKKADEAAKNS